MTFRGNILKIILALFAAILSTTLFLSLISKASWNNNPQFGFSDCKLRKIEEIKKFLLLIIVFVFGTLVEQNQARFAKLKSSSIKLFVGLWIFSIVIITHG